MSIDPVKLGKGIQEYIVKGIAPLVKRVAELEKRQPEKGEKGDSGNDGLDGKDGIQGPQGDQGPQGEKGERGEPGKDGNPGKDGKDGNPGKDGKSISIEEARGLLTDIHEMSVSKWALDFERRASDLIQRCIDRIPAPENGKDGRDGVGFDDLTVEHDGTGLVSIKFIRGSVTKSFDIRLPVLIDKGIFKDEEIYQKGDCVTCGGSLWIAQTDKAVGKPGISEDWRLAVKRGRDGKDFSK